MSYYTEKNGLAQFWNRDNTRMEWAKWVYHHPEQTEELLERLLSGQDSSEIQEALENLEAVNEEQSRRILNLERTHGISLEALSDADIDRITGVNLDNPEPVPALDIKIYEPMSNEDIDEITGVNLNG